MSINLSAALRDQRLDIIMDAIDGAGGAGLLRFYPGARVGSPTLSPGVALLAETQFQRPSSAGATGGILTFLALTEATVLADGTTTWARILDSAETGLIDLDVGLVGSGAEIELDIVALVTGATLRINAAALTES